MELTDARTGDAIELPEGLYTLAAVTHHRAAALDWIVWELIPDEHTAGGPVMFGLIEGQPYRVKIVVVDALPQEDQVTVDHMIYELRGQGEARGERSDLDGKRDFWLSPYRLYEREGLPLLFHEAHGRVIRLTFERMDSQLVRLYQ